MTKPERRPNTRRRQFIQLLNSVDRYWMDVLGDNLFHDLNYYDLFTQMWLRLSDRSCDAFYKSELYQFMPHISQRTAIKYIQIAIDHGLLIEEIDTDDLRSRKITMSENLKQKIELFLDHSISIFEAAPSPTSKPEVSTTGDEAIE